MPPRAAHTSQDVQKSSQKRTAGSNGVPLGRDSEDLRRWRPNCKNYAPVEAPAEFTGPEPAKSLRVCGPGLEITSSHQDLEAAPPQNSEEPLKAVKAEAKQSRNGVEVILK